MPRKPRSGPKPKQLNDDERSEFFRLRRSGLGLRSTLQKLKIGWARFNRTRKEDKAFRDEANAIDTELIEALWSMRFQAAVRDKDAHAQEFLINRFDRMRQFQENMQLRRSEIKRRLAAGEDSGENPTVEAIRALFGKLAGN